MEHALDITDAAQQAAPGLLGPFGVAEYVPAATAQKEFDRLQMLHTGLMTQADQRWDEQYAANRELTHELAQAVAQRDALAKVAQEFIDEATAIAQTSYRRWDGSGGCVWNDDVWREAEPEQFALVEAARAAIATIGATNG